MKSVLEFPRSLQWELLVFVGVFCVMATSDRVVKAGGNNSSRYIAYVGTYSQNGSKGIYRLEFNSETGSLKLLEGTNAIENSSFLAIHPNRKYLYAVSEVAKYKGKDTGSVVAYRIEGDQGELVELNQLATGGAVPCHLSIDSTGHCLVIANYTGGSIASFRLKENGELDSPMASLMQHHGQSINKQRQESAHAHSANISADDRLVYAADLGIDQIIIYQLDPQTAKLSENEPSIIKIKPGSGPRHFTFHPQKDFAYVLNELSCDIIAFKRNPDNGDLKTLQTIPTVPEVKPGYSTAEIRIHPNGKFLYASNRGHNSLATYRIDKSTGLLTALGNEPTGGEMPRNFTFDPTGKFILAANRVSNNIIVFRIDQETGLLTRTENEVKIPMPVCIRFLLK